jgi:hypothetical protein
MKRKRLQHHADTLAQMACGWRIVNDLKTLAQAESGELTINVLSASTLLDGKPLSRLGLTRELSAWLLKDAEANGIPLDLLHRAEVRLRFKAYLSDDHTVVHFDRFATSVVEYDGRAYTGEFTKVDEPGYRL